MISTLEYTLIYPLDHFHMDRQESPPSICTWPKPPSQVPCRSGTFLLSEILFCSDSKIFHARTSYMVYQVVWCWCSCPRLHRHHSVVTLSPWWYHHNVTAKYVARWWYHPYGTDNMVWWQYHRGNAVRLMVPMKLRGDSITVVILSRNDFIIGDDDHRWCKSPWWSCAKLNLLQSTATNDIFVVSK